MESNHVLVVDDDRQLASMLTELLQLERYRVTCAPSGESGLRCLTRDPPDIVLLDVTLPGMDGFAILERIRALGDTPVIMLTARGEPDDRIRGLARGADDYLPKPFNARELLLRIAAVLARSGANTRRDQDTYDGLRVDRSAGVACVGDTPIDLTETEWRILDQLVRFAPDVVSRDRLSHTALGRAHSPGDRALDTHISNLRHKLAAAVPNLAIHSVRASGYRLRPQAPAA